MKTKVYFFIIVSSLFLLFSSTSKAQVYVGKSGYKGFVTIGVGGEAKNFTHLTFFEIQTTHGYQISPYLFGGAGVGVQLFNKDEIFGDKFLVAPNFYGALRYNFLFHAITPFIEGKVGLCVPYSLEASDFLNPGLYANPSIGCHFSLRRKFGLDISIGYDYQRVPVRDKFYVEKYGGKVRENLSKVVLRFGIDF